MNQRHNDKVRFKQEARDFFEQQSADETELENLLQKTQATPPMPQSFQWRPALSTMAALVVLVAVYLWLPPRTDIAQQIANEVAKNHINMKPLEIQTQNIGELRQYFTELDFSVAQSARFSDRNQILLGARYCSIKGVTAAQIRYDNAEGNAVTLYEVGYDPGTFGQLPALEDNEPPMRIKTQGVSVTLWTESGLLMAEVSDIN